MIHNIKSMDLGSYYAEGLQDWCIYSRNNHKLEIATWDKKHSISAEINVSAEASVSDEASAFLRDLFWFWPVSVDHYRPHATRPHGHS